VKQDNFVEVVIDGGGTQGIEAAVLRATWAPTGGGVVLRINRDPESFSPDALSKHRAVLLNCYDV